MLLLLLSILPAIILLVYICKKDKTEKEPFGLLLSLFFLGALTVVSAVVIGLACGVFLEDVFEEDDIIYILIDNFLVTALVEEGGKYFVMKKRTWNHPAFNYTFDGVVYAVFTSLGFALVENILYVFDGGLTTAIMRAVMSVPGHAIFGIYMGMYYGMSKLKGKKKPMLRTLWVPVLIHGFYDFCLSMESGLFIAIFFVFEIIITISAFRKVKKLSKNDQPIESDESYIKI